MKSRRLISTDILLRVMMVAAGGCASPDPMSGPEGAEPVGIAQQAATSTPTCVTVQRGVSGNVVDTYVSSGDGTNLNRNFGASSLWISSSTSEGLVRFDLSAVPSGATITSASMTLNVARVTSSSQQSVRVHRITAAWDELSVTYNTFNQAFSPAVEASFLPVVGAPTVDVQHVVQEWISGQSPNYGLLLEEDAPSSAAYFSGEYAAAGMHPSLTACYTVTTCPAGHADCNGKPADGCEAALNTAINCGACGVNCDDSDPCTMDSCQGGTCTHAAVSDGTSCNDGNACTQTDTCQAGACVGSNAVACTAPDQCHLAGTCDPTTGACSNPAKADGASCDDGNACTTGDACHAGVCTETAISVDDGNPCTADSCDSVTGTVHHVPTPGASCSTGNPCQAPGTCSAAGVCQTSANMPAGAACSDGNPCNGTEQCDGAGQCKAGTRLSDGANCSGDTCSPMICSTGQCVAGPLLPDGSSCADGSPCKAGATCQAGRCDATVNNGTSCSDDDACNGLEACLSGVCARGTPPAIPPSPADPCTSQLCDPATGAITQVTCSPINPTSPTDLAQAADFIIAQQPGAVIDPMRISVLRGLVADPSGQPMPNVAISIIGDSASGQARTRLDGHFDMAVNGGGTLRVRYMKAHYLTVERTVEARWKDYARLPDVVLMPLDPAVTPVILGHGTFQVARGSFVSDADGVRRATILFPPNTGATLVFPDGSKAPLTNQLSVRATEYTVGPNGPKAMPAGLPATSAYTYAVELSADEVRSAGATQVRFTNTSDPSLDQYVFAYLENFIGFPVGETMPSGYYDQQAGAWVPSGNDGKGGKDGKDGRVVQILSIAGGQATLATKRDAQGHPVHDSPDEQALGITPEECAELASLYVAGQTIWRMPLSHFTPYDFNQAGAPPPDACKPLDASCQPADPTHPAPKPDDPCETTGSTIECQGQVLGERIPVVGTPYRLTYASDRVPGRKDAYALSIPLVGVSPPASLLRIELRIEVAGQIIEPVAVQCPCAGLPPYRFQWDGKDGFGRTVQGQQPILIYVRYVYKQQYRDPPTLQDAFGAYAAAGLSQSFEITGNRSAGEVSPFKLWRGVIGAWDERGEGLGGWSLNVHHVYDPAGRVLYRGDGTRQSAAGIRPAITTVVGGGSYNAAPIDCPNPAPGGCSATTVYGGIPEGVVVAPDGSVIFADSNNGRVRKVDVSGRVTTVALIPAASALALGPGGNLYVASYNKLQIYRIDPLGNVTVVAGDGTSCSVAARCGDGGLATAAQMSGVFGVTALSVGPDGSLYLIDGLRLRRVTSDGLIQTIAGDGSCSGAPGSAGVPALQTGIGRPTAVLAAPDGNVYIASNGCYSAPSFIEMLTPGGTLEAVAGSYTGSSGDGAPAKSTVLTSPGALAMSAEGLLVFNDNNRVRQIGKDSVVTTIAGLPPPTCKFSYCGDGVPATASNLGTVNGLVFAHDRSLLIASNPGRVLRVDTPLPSFGVGTFLLPSADASEVYAFDTTGRHLETRDALTGALEYTFGYEADPQTGKLGRLKSVGYAPGASHVTTFAYDDANLIRTVTSPFGDVTTLALDSFGNLSAASHRGGPANAPRVEAYTLAATPDGLLTSFSDPNGTLLGQPHTLSYDTSSTQPTGRLTSDSDPAGGNQSLSLNLVSTSNGPEGTVTRQSLGDGGRTYANSYEITFDSKGNEIRTNQLATASNPVVTTIATDGARTTTLPDGTIITSSATPDPRYGLLSPTSTTVTKLPLGGLSRAESVVRFVDAQKGLHETDTMNGNTFDMRYDPAQRTLTHTTPAGRTSTTQLDAQGRVAAQTMPGFGSMSFAYTTDFSQLGTMTRHAVGEQDRVSQSTYYAPGAGPGLAGNLASITDPLLDTTSFDVYDLAGRALHTTLAGGRPVGFTYDANGNLVELDPPPATPRVGASQALQAQHMFGYTSIDQLASYQVRDQAAVPNTFLETTSYGYTPDRLVKTLVRPEGDQVSYTSSLGRLDQVALPGGVENVHRVYDPATGRLQGLIGPMGVGLTFAYNGSLVTDVTWSGLAPGMTVHRDHDNNFRVTGETAQGLPLFFGYDADGLLQCVGTTQGTSCAGGLSIARTPGTSLLSSTTFPVAGTTPISEAYTPNGFGETLGYVAKIGTQAAYTVSYTRDSLGRIATRSEALRNADGTASAASFTYTYDAAGRLTEVLAGDGTLVHYDYDANGNRLRRSIQGPGGNGEELGTYGMGDQLQTYAGRTYHYTASGVLHDVVDANGTTTYTYDALGNLRTVALSGGKTIDYVIDGKNRRVGKKIDGQLVKAWLYEDDLRIAAEVDLNGQGTVTGTKRFGYGSKANVPDLMLMQDGTRYRILSDHLGGPRTVVMEAGQLVARMDYDEFGRVLTNTQPGLVPFGFAGGLFDPDTGLVRFGARDYDANSGRWTTKDVLKFGGMDTNLYTYVANDPTDFRDSSGLIRRDEGGGGGEGGPLYYDPTPSPALNASCAAQGAQVLEDPRQKFCVVLAAGFHIVCTNLGFPSEECLDRAEEIYKGCLH